MQQSYTSLKSSTNLTISASSVRLWLAYIAVMVSLTGLCFGSMRDHSIDIHDSDAFSDHLAISKDFFFFFSSDKLTASGRIVDEFVMWVAYLVWGNDPALFHLLSVTTHLMASLSLAFLYWRISCEYEIAMLGGLLFLLHIGHIQAVQWISALEYPLSVLVGTLTVHAYLHFMQNHTFRTLTLFYLLLSLSLLTHIALLMIWPFCLILSIQHGMKLRAALSYFVPIAFALVPIVFIVAETTPRHSSTTLSLDYFSSSSISVLLLNVASMFSWFFSRLFTTAHWLPLPMSYIIGN